MWVTYLEFQYSSSRKKASGSNRKNLCSPQGHSFKPALGFVVVVVVLQMQRASLKSVAHSIHKISVGGKTLDKESRIQRTGEQDLNSRPAFCVIRGWGRGEDSFIKQG